MDRLTQMEKDIANIQKELLTIEQLRRRMNNMESWISTNLVHASSVKLRPPNDTIAVPPPTSAVRTSPNNKDTITNKGIENPPKTEVMSNVIGRTVKITNCAERQEITVVNNDIDRQTKKEKVSSGTERQMRQGKNETTSALEKVMTEPESKGHVKSTENAVGKSKQQQQQPSNKKLQSDSNQKPKNQSDSSVGARVLCKPEAPKVTTTGLDLPLNPPFQDQTVLSKMTNINIKTVPYNPTKVGNPEITSTDTAFDGPCLQDSRIISIVKGCTSLAGKEEYLAEMSSASCQNGTNNDGISSTTPTKPLRSNAFCKKCMTYFPNAKIYTQHKLKIHQKFVCRYCDRRFEAFAFLKQHESDAHHKLKVLQKQDRISNANNKQPDLIMVRKDIFMSNDYQPQKQGSAKNSTIVGKQGVNNYSKSSGTECEKVHSCPNCQKTFKYSNHLKQHMTNHQDNSAYSACTSTTKQTMLCHFDKNGNFVATNGN